MTLFGKFVFGLAFLFIGAGVYFATSSYVTNDMKSGEVAASEVTEAASTTELMSTSTATSSKKIPFSKFLEKGGSYTCRVVQNITSVTSTGTVFIDEKDIKATFNMSTMGQIVDTNIIIRDGYIYTWTSMQKGTGIKVKIIEGQTEDMSTTTPQATYTWNGDQVGDYDCTPWTVDEGVFVLPKDIKFTESKA